MKKIITLAMMTTLLILTIITPNVSESEPIKQIGQTISIGDSIIELEEFDKINNKITLNVNGKQTAEVFYDTGEFIIENEDGVREYFNVKDFEVSEDAESFSSLEETIKVDKQINDDMIAPTEIYNPRKFLGGMQEELGFSRSTIMTNTANYIKRGYYVQVFTGTEWKVTRVPQKYSFGVGTMLVTIAAVVTAFLGLGFSIGALATILNTLGVTIFGETINRLFTPTMSVEQQNVGRYYYLYNQGGTTKTLHTYNYIKVEENGKWVRELYSTDTYNNMWYHNYSVEKVAEVAAERLRWIIGLRSTAPNRGDFDW